MWAAPLHDAGIVILFWYSVGPIPMVRIVDVVDLPNFT